METIQKSGSTLVPSHLEMAAAFVGLIAGHMILKNL